ncbi:UNVERIFIED_CONTAM: hypothetical protein Scaly_1459000 [Sesamum calycinum]|uniref:Uncharacterized protein n=1 Tax=Sesamum calycinum TaxID=2727403 RepID=A0AAW2PP77_9LAMI
MAESKIDLPEDLIVSKPSDQSWILKASTGKDEDKGLVGLLDESKDQAVSESIPLSPQWLYAKPNEPKMDTRGPSSLSLGSSADLNQKEVWRSDTPEDKKDWRRIAPEPDSGRRWREEERETGLLGRRDRKKMDRRVDNAPGRETENRSLPPADRWHDVSSRNSAHEMRRDSKWSLRWGPDDKEKDARMEKRTDVEKEESQGESQTYASNSRSVPERDSDTRDKWRPRHRMEGNTGGSGSYRAAPGFGLERGRIEGSNVGFTVGRGRSSVSILRPPSAGPIGTTPLDSSFTDMPDHLEEVPPITKLDAVEPLAFVSPDSEQEAILNDIWKGKIKSSGAAYSSSRKGGSADNVSGARREPGVNTANLDASGRRDAQFRRTSSCNDADVLETSFSDMLKSSAKKPAPQETHASATESSDGMAGARNNKKKGKKGRQIDPALLGFKVTSNRIMMGEIQRIDD